MNRSNGAAELAGQELERPAGDLESAIASRELDSIVRWARYYAQEADYFSSGPDLAGDALHDVGYFLTGEMQSTDAVVAAAKRVAREHLGHGDLVDEYERVKAARDV